MEDTTTLKNIFQNQVNIEYDDDRNLVYLTFTFEDEEVQKLVEEVYYPQDLERKELEWVENLVENINDMCFNSYEFEKLTTSDSEGYRIFTLILRYENLEEGC